MIQISHYGNESNQRCEIKDIFSRILRHKGKGGLPSGRRSFLDFFYSFESCSTLPGTPNFLTWKIFIRFLHTHNFKGEARLNHLWRKALFYRRFTTFFLKTDNSVDQKFGKKNQFKKIVKNNLGQKIFGQHFFGQKIFLGSTSFFYQKFV